VRLTVPLYACMNTLVVICCHPWQHLLACRVTVIPPNPSVHGQTRSRYTISRCTTSNSWSHDTRTQPTHTHNFAEPSTSECSAHALPCVATKSRLPCGSTAQSVLSPSASIRCARRTTSLHCPTCLTEYVHTSLFKLVPPLVLMFSGSVVPNARWTNVPSKSAGSSRGAHPVLQRVVNGPRTPPTATRQINVE
jgi:hypothetical protein